MKEMIDICTKNKRLGLNVVIFIKQIRGGSHHIDFHNSWNLWTIDNAKPKFQKINEKTDNSLQNTTD